MQKNENENVIDSKKREFMKKFGGYAATAPVGMYMLMTPSSSAAHTSGCATTPRNKAPKHKQHQKKHNR